MKVLRLLLLIAGIVLIIILLTIVTQVGGVIFMLSLLFYPWINRKNNHIWIRSGLKVLLFSILYLACTFLIVPPLAKHWGRVALPMIGDHHVKPAIYFTILANRHYVKPSLHKILLDAGDKMNRTYPGTMVNYLDANFPFIDGFRLWPHLSHNDGKKLDISFQYDDSRTQVATTSIPSFIGYGICEDPTPGEENMPLTCSLKGYWQYNLLTHVASQKNKRDFRLNEQRTKKLIETIAHNKEIVKFYIEPHLKTRWKIKTNKVRFHGCQAVRHDDHVHIQIR